jgi:hypothetical protein
MEKGKIIPWSEAEKKIDSYNSQFSARGDPYGSRMGIALSRHMENLNTMSGPEKTEYASKVVAALDTGTLTKEPLEA